MNFINLRTSMLRSPEYLGSEPVSRATWLGVLCYCHEQETGGKIKGGALWSDRQWQQIAGVTRDEVMAARLLVFIEGDDVRVFGFNVEKQREVQAKRKQAGEAARRRWDSKIGAGRDASRIAPRIAPRNAEGEGEGEGEGVCVSKQREKEDHTQGTKPPPPHDDFPHDDLSAAGWLPALRQKWPAVNIDAEMRRAEAYVRKKRGPEAKLGKAFFENEWLPKCTDAVEVPQRSAAIKRDNDVPEPPGWREVLAGSVYGRGEEREAKSWATLPPEVKAHVRQELTKEDNALG